MSKRVVVLVDMDSFYVQVEQQLAPETRFLPCAVVQYNTWRGGSVLAVDYTARQYGVVRGMTGEEATAKCPQLHLFRVPKKRGKADLTRYRQVGAKVIQTLSQHCQQVERASVDEAFLELSGLSHAHLSAAADLPNTVVAGEATKDDDSGGVEGASRDEGKRTDSVANWLEKKGNGEDELAVAAVMVQQMREAVWRETGCTCSAGIAHNKMLAKLAAGMNKPNGQTIFPSSSVPAVFSTTPISKVRHLGGKLGAELANQLKIVHIGELADISMATLQSMFGQKTGAWLYGLCRGRDEEPVRPRQLPQSLGCGKNFPGPAKLTTKEQLLHWLELLGCELVERLREDRHQNRRYARQLAVHFQLSSSDRGVSRCCPMPEYDLARMVESAWNAIDRYCSTQPWTPLGVIELSLSASKFSDCSSQPLRTFLHCKSSNGTASVNADIGACSKRSHQDHNNKTVKEQASALAVVNEMKGVSDEANAPTDEEQLCPGRQECEEYPDEVLEKCSECAEKVPVWLLREHIDHHLAIKLQKQEQQRSGQASRDKLAIRHRTLTIDTFFQKK